MDRQDHDERPAGRLLRLRPTPRRLPRWTFRATKDVYYVDDHWREHLRMLRLRSYDVTDNEAKVAWLVNWGCPSKVIAEALGVSRSTVTAAIGRLLRKFEVRNRRQLLRMVRCLVYAEPPPAGI